MRLAVENWKRIVDTFSGARNLNDTGRTEVQCACVCCLTLLSILLISLSGTCLLAAPLTAQIRIAWNHLRNLNGTLQTGGACAGSFTEDPTVKSLKRMDWNMYESVSERRAPEI